MPVVQIQQSLADQRAEESQRPDEQMRPQQPAGGRVVVATGQVKLEIEQAKDVGQSAAKRAVFANHRKGFGHMQPAGIAALVGLAEMVFAQHPVRRQNDRSAAFEAIP